MAMIRRIKSRGVLTGRLSHGGDLLDEITDICRRENVQLGWFEALGAVKKARLAFYNQETHDYELFVLDQPLEITKLVGNVSLKDGDPFVHAHMTLADKAGNTYGGHLASGTIVFACEFMLEIFEGPALRREFDEVTGLSLWTMQDEKG